MPVNNIYRDGTYLESNPDWHVKDSPWKAKQIADLLARNRFVPETVCEVGCGAGEILACLSKIYGDKVTFHGYEISPQAFEICRRKEQPNVCFHFADLLVTEKVFDVVMAIDVFEHVENYIGFLRDLKPKGTYKLFHIPLDLSVFAVLRCSPILKARHSVGHLHYFTKETALETLRDTGYQIVDWCYTRDSLELPQLGWPATMMKLPRRLFFALHQDLAARILGGFSLLVLTK